MRVLSNHEGRIPLKDVLEIVDTLPGQGPLNAPQHAHAAARQRRGIPLRAGGSRPRPASRALNRRRQGFEPGLAADRETTPGRQERADKFAEQLDLIHGAPLVRWATRFEYRGPCSSSCI